MTFDGSGTTQTGAINNGSTSTAGALVKNGEGTLILTASGNFGGSATINNGTVEIRHANALGTTAGSTTIKGDTFDGRLAFANNITVAENITLEARQNATATAVAIDNLSGNNTYTGTLTFTTGGTNYNINSSAGHLAINGTIAGNLTGTRNIRLGGAGTGSVGAAIGTLGSATVTVNKLDAGTWTLSGDNTYTGGTTVTAGTLLANNTAGSATGTGNVTVNGGTLGGTGTISGTTTFNGGQLTAGTAGSVGTLTFGTDLVMGSGSTWLVDFLNDQADFINVQSGAITLAGSLSISHDGSWQPNKTYQIARYQTLTGTFNGLPGGERIGDFFINYGSGNNDYITLQAIPEPETWAATLLILALGFLLHSRRSRPLRNDR
jgi:autotransporter-associated beta strand protein